MLIKDVSVLTPRNIHKLFDMSTLKSGIFTGLYVSVYEVSSHYIVKTTPIPDWRCPFTVHRLCPEPIFPKGSVHSRIAGRFLGRVIVRGQSESYDQSLRAYQFNTGICCKKTVFNKPYISLRGMIINSQVGLVTSKTFQLWSRKQL